MRSSGIGGRLSLRDHCFVLPGLVLLAACGSTGSPGAAATGGTRVSVDAQDSMFRPTTITVRAGDRVTLTINNRDAYEHNFSVPELKLSQDVEKGASSTVTFTASGGSNLQFFCKYHRAKGMVGVLDVGGSNTPAAGSSAAPSSGGSAPAYGAY
jgi:plastocyanin